MPTGPYDPCPCGSGKKYRFCCQKQDQDAAAAKRQAERAAEQQFLREVAQLDELSNRANDLIRKGKWDEAEAACAELRQRFPDAIDADERLALLYTRQNQFDRAKEHTLAALAIAESRPDSFDPDFIADLKAEVAYLDECIAVGRLVD